MSLFDKDLTPGWIVVKQADYDALAAALATERESNAHLTGLLRQVDVARIRELEAAEHRARCDLIDALFFVGMVWGQFGFPPTEAEREIARSFYDRIEAKYPQQKGCTTLETLPKLPINPQWDGCRECGYQLPRHAPGCPNYAQTETGDAGG